MLDDGFLSLWTELVEAYHGINGFGGDTAEIYAYTLMPFSYAPDAFAEGQQAGLRRLIAICQEFERLMICKLLLDGFSLAEWQVNAFAFKHRVHIKVIR
jgi:hypothetical protein